MRAGAPYIAYRLYLEGRTQEAIAEAVGYNIWKLQTDEYRNFPSLFSDTTSFSTRILFMRRSGFFQDDFRPQNHHTTTMQKTLTLLVLQGNTPKTR